jgi:hypothetical protein
LQSEFDVACGETKTREKDCVVVEAGLRDKVIVDALRKTEMDYVLCSLDGFIH